MALAVVQGYLDSQETQISTRKGVGFAFILTNDDRDVQVEHENMSIRWCVR